MGSAEGFGIGSTLRSLPRAEASTKRLASGRCTAALIQPAPSPRCTVRMCCLVRGRGRGRGGGRGRVKG